MINQKLKINSPNEIEKRIIMAFVMYDCTGSRPSAVSI